MSQPPKKTLETTDEFDDELLTLAKKYRAIEQDIKPILTQLENGDTLGDRIPNLKELVYKVRVANTSAKRGKSGGFRLIYYMSVADTIYLLTIYSKTQQSDVALLKLTRLIAEIKKNRDSSEE
jgi:mRNA-degrading endonuclease RelE of RelBE toxin-antitoxin system